MATRSSYFIAGGVALALAGWLASGQLGAELVDGEAQEPEARVAAAATVPVRVRPSEAVPVAREVVVSGRTEANRDVELRAETSGRVVEVGSDRGAEVDLGDVLLRLDPRERAAMVRKAEATLRQRELEFEAATELGKKGFQAETRVAEARAALEAARAELELSETTLEHTTIEAPFAGILESRPVEVGDFVDVGDPVATLIEQDPFLVVGDLSEGEVGEVSLGMDGAALLASGRRVEGRITYVASAADPATRTFRVEMTVDNPIGRLKAGMTANLTIAIGEVMAHLVPASSLTLDDSGVLGIKAVDASGRVAFHPAEVVRADGGKLWLAGLPDTLDLITVGQGFVREGDSVEAVPEEGEGSSVPLVAERRS